ncbi:hypothetical protein Vafri_5950 [Volvox africanus]|nr:hypothetical protein Vafri_5950 [Volvox africanus]
MGRFHGSLAEDLTAEAMIHGWEAVCKLWEASSVLDSCDLNGPAIDTADKMVQQHLRDALKLFETALDKFSCKIVYDIVGHAYNPILHELDRSDPEVEAFRGSIGTLGGAVLNDLLCGAAVATVVRPGLEVTGIMRARPRVWVTLPSTRGEQTSQTGIAPVPAQHQQQLRFGSFAFKVPVLGAKASTNSGQAQKSEAPRALSDAVQSGNVKASAVPSSGADAATSHSAEQSGSATQISTRNVSPPSPRLAARPAFGASSWVSERSTTQHGDLEQHHGAEESTGCATRQGSSPAYVAATPAAGGVIPSLPQPPQRPVASFTGAGPKGPLQLLLALRTGRRTGPAAVPATTTAADTKEDNSSSFRTAQDPGTGEPAGSELEAAVAGGGGQKMIKRSGAYSGPAMKESPTGRLRKGTGAADTSGPRSDASGARDAESPGGSSHYRGLGSDDVDNDDDVCYQQYDTSTHHPATQPRPAVGAAVQPQRRSHHPAPVRAATTMMAAVVSPPGAGSTPSADAVPRLAMATCGVSSSIGGGGQAGPVPPLERRTTACPDGRCNPAGPVPAPSLDRSASTAIAAGAVVPTGIDCSGGFEAVKEAPMGSTYSVSHGAPEVNETSGSASGSDRTSTSRNSAAGAAPTRRSDSGGNGGNLNPARSATAAAAAAAASCGVPSSAALAAAAAVRAAVAAAAAANSRAGIPSSTAQPMTTPRTAAVRAAPQLPPSSSATVIANADPKAGSDGDAAVNAAAASPPSAHAARWLPSSEFKVSGVEPGASAGATSGRPRMEAPPRRTAMPGAGKHAADAITPVAAVAAAATCSGAGLCSDGSQGHGPAQSHQGPRRQSETVQVAQMARGGHLLAATEGEQGDEDLRMSQPMLGASPPTGHIYKTTSRSSGTDLSAASVAQPPHHHHHLFPRKQRSSHTSIVSATSVGNTNAVSEPSRASGNPGRGAGRGARASQDQVELTAAAAVTTTVADGGGRDSALRQQRHISRGRRRGTGLGIGQPLPPPASKQQQQQQQHEQQRQHHDYQPHRHQQLRQDQEQHMGRTDRLSQVSQAHQREHYERHPPSDAPRPTGKVPPAHSHSEAATAGVWKPGGGGGRGSGGTEASAVALRAEESLGEASVLTARGGGGAGTCGGEEEDAEEDEEQVEGEGCGDMPGYGTWAAGRRGGRGGGGWRGRWGLRRQGGGGGGSWRRRGAGGLVAGAGPNGGRPTPQ